MRLGLLSSRKGERRLHLKTRQDLLRGIALSVLALAAPEAVEAQSAPEYAIEAAYLVKIAPFIEWPDGSFSSAAAPLSVCVLGADPFGPALDLAAKGQKDNSHPIEVRRVNAPDTHCQILYMQGSVDPSVLAALKGKPVVTVSDGASGQDAGIFNFVVQDNHVRFEIDQASANAAGLKISSKLLSLAVSVRGAP